MSEIKKFWNDRYSNEDYIYGSEPNQFFAEQLGTLKPGKLILPCEGEGRNAVYAASKGWDVSAFDSSEEGKAKALKLAAANSVNIEYDVIFAENVDYPTGCADVVAFIYTHFTPELRKQLCSKVISWLKPGGKIILEVFHTSQLPNKSGGPKDISMLCTTDIVQSDFEGLEIELLEHVQIELNEGSYHRGLAEVIRMVGHKK